MIEDKLSHDERLRLECLGQANMSSSPNSTAEMTISKAKRFEEFIKSETKYVFKETNND